MSYSIILPTLNEAGHIEDLIKKINSVFLEIPEKFEIIIVDDDSTDGTDKLCNQMLKEYENLKFFSRKGLKKNLANSINLGIKESKHENIIWMDADFQHPPDFFKQFYIQKDKFDVLIGVNLLREGLDLPEVSLVAILDADKEGFLRSHRSLTQTIGRAARHVNGIAILYADKITNSIKKTIDETNYRRTKQIEYNKKNGIVPKPIVKSIDNPLTKRLLRKDNEEISETVIDFKIPNKSKDFDKKIRELRREMEKSAKELDFKSAALYRDQIKKLKEIKSSSF